MEIAIQRNNFEVLIILAEFAEVPPEMKADFLRLILENEGEEQYAAEFKKNLEGLSVSEVGLSYQALRCCPGLGKATELVLASQAR